MPSVVADAVSPSGMCQTRKARTAAESSADTAASQAGSLSTASMTKRTIRGTAATIAERPMLFATGS
jgi:hypothetical protein